MEILIPDEYRVLYEPYYTPRILKIPHPALRSVAKPVAKVTKRHQELIKQMIREMRGANGIGLAAPQLGVLERVIVIAPGGLKPLALINPQITAAEGQVVGQEGCLSVPGLYGDVERAEKVEIQAQDRTGATCTWEMEGLAARVVQHEIDHLDGVLFFDKADIATLHWEMPSGASPVE